MSVRFCPIASGSSGNSIYFGASDKCFIIDAGLSGKRISQCLSHIGVPRIDALFITHEHSDHVSGAGVISRRYRIPLYATPKTWRYLLRHKVIGPVDESLVRQITPDKPTDVMGVTVTAFEIPHDASQPVGYSFSFEDKKVSVATDMGRITDTVKNNLSDSNIVLIESNHDVEMLVNGRYPKQLKDRVMSDRGHLSNASAGVLLSEVASAELRYAYLGHLSEENNRPLVALDTVQSILDANRVIIRNLIVAERYAPSEMAVL